MNKNECFELGHLAKPHGINGNFHLILDVDDPGEYEGLQSFFIEIGSSLVPYFIEDLQISAKQSLVKLEGIDHIDDTKDLVGKKIFLPLEFLPELEEDQFYFHEIIGFLVQDKNLGKLGLIKEVVGMGTNDLLIMEYQNREILIPLTEEIVLKVIKNDSIIQTDLPEGLIDIYLNDEN